MKRPMGKPVEERESAQQIEEAAVRWLWRLDRDGRAPEREAELEAWLGGDSRRRGAYLQAEASWRLLDRANLLTGDAAPTGGHGELLARRKLLIGGGAAIAASLAGLGLVLSSGRRISTVTGEVRRVPLGDGSVAAVNTRSVIQVAFHTRQRTIRLDDGEAWFRVAKDVGRPFVVEAGNVRVRAVGTAFSVRRRESGAEVIVTEGVVETWALRGEDRMLRLAAGEAAFVNADPGVTSTITPGIDVDRKLAWREGKVELSGETLAEAVDEFNRYNQSQLVIREPTAAHARLYGEFRADDPSTFAKAANASLMGDAGVAVEFKPNG
jgi:transmembrane sensor